jgi:hypothetical protein
MVRGPCAFGGDPPERRQGLQDAIQALKDVRAGVLAVGADDRLSRHTDHPGWIATEVADLGARVVDASNPGAEWIVTIRNSAHLAGIQ